MEGRNAQRGVEKPEESIDIDLGKGLGKVNVTYKEATGKDFLEMGRHKATEEQFLMCMCRLLLYVDKELQPIEWWEDLRMSCVKPCMTFVQQWYAWDVDGASGEDGDSNPLE